MRFLLDPCTQTSEANSTHYYTYLSIIFAHLQSYHDILLQNSFVKIMKVIFGRKSHINFSIFRCRNFSTLPGIKLYDETDAVGPARSTKV